MLPSLRVDGASVVNRRVTVSEFILQRQAITRFVRDTLQSAVDKPKENADKHGRKKHEQVQEK